METNSQNNSPIKLRILEYLENKGVSQYEYYKNTGTTRGVLAQNNGISEENISKFLAYAQDVNIHWLITGQGKPTIQNVKELVDEHIKQISNEFDLRDKERDELLRNNDNVATGHTRKIYELLESEYPELFSFKKNYDNIINFSDAIEHLKSSLGAKIENSFWLYPKGKFDFKQYSGKVVRTLEEVSEFQVPFNELNVAVQKFYRDLNNIDSTLINPEDYII